MSRQPIIVVPGEPRIEYATRDVHEHRAPTDASVKLLKEMEQAAEARVIDAIKVGDSTFECVVHKMHDMMSDQMVWRAVFKLNGRQEKAEHRCPTGIPIQYAMLDLRDAIAKVIANRMITEAMATLHEKP